MSFNNKPNRPDSKETARLRAEYEKKAVEFRESRDPATKAKLRDEKEKLFGRVVSQMTAERRETLSETQKALARMGRFKTDEQLREERAKVETARAARG